MCVCVYSDSELSNTFLPVCLLFLSTGIQNTISCCLFELRSFLGYCICIYPVLGALRSFAGIKLYFIFKAMPSASFCVLCKCYAKLF